MTDPKTIREQIEDLDAELGGFDWPEQEDYEPNPYDGTYSEE